MLDSCAICLSLPEPSQNSIAVIYAFTASVLKVAVNHTTFQRQLCGILQRLALIMVVIKSQGKK